MRRANWSSQSYPSRDSGHRLLGVMEKTEGLIVQQTNELVCGIGATRRQVVINPLACSFLLVTMDLFLLGILSISCFGDTGSTTAGGFSSNCERLVFISAPFIVALSLWRQGAYTVDQR